MEKKHSSWNNALFILCYTYKINKVIFLSRIPQILLNAASSFIPIIFTRFILNEITEGKDQKRLLSFVLLFGGFTFLASFLNAVLDYFVKNQMEITVRKIKNQLGIHVMNMNYYDAEQPKIRDFISLAQDGTNFSDILDHVSNIITAVFTVTGLFAILVSIEPIILVFLCLVVIVRLLADKKNRILWEKWRPRYAPIMRKSDYYFKIMKTIEFGKEVRINHLQDWIFTKTNRHTEDYLKASAKHNMELQKNSILSFIVSLLQEGAVYVILAYKVVFQGMPIGDFSMYTTSVSTFSGSIRSIVSSVAAIMQTGIFVEDFRTCIELACEQKENAAKKVTELDQDNIEIKFQDVSFKYPNTESYILKNITLTLTKKESISLVGLNGAGKTTFIKLLCRFYEPNEGTISVNGIDIRQFNYEEYSSLIGIVFQDFKMLAFSVEDNVTFGQQADQAQVIECMEKSGLKNKLCKLTNGIQTSVSKEFDSTGIEFSGGEAQKLAIARILYKKTPIVILDEPTAALDPIAEFEIYSKLNEIAENKLAIYISHRLSSCQFCNKIAVFDQGEIVQYGRHEELLNAEGLYRRMWNIQAQYYDIRAYGGYTK